jgi:O-antigen ligase
MRDMLASEADAVRGPFLDRLPSAVLGTIVLASIVAGLISPRTIPFVLGIMLVSLLISAAFSGRMRQALPRLDFLNAALLAFVLWAAISALWSEVPSLVLTKSGLAFIILLATLVMVRLISREDTMNALHMADGVWVGAAMGLTYFFIELVSDQSVKIWVFNTLALGPDVLKPARHFAWADGRIVAISPIDLTRNTTLVSLLIWPAALAACVTAPHLLRRPLSLGLIVLGIAVIALSTHETSKLAVVVGLIGYALARLSHTWAYRLMAAAWIACCLLIMPASILAHRADLHNASWLQPSAQHRIIIWNHTAEQTLQHDPLFGVGANMTHILGPRLNETTENGADEQHNRTLSRHAHNIFLQTWFELGAVGAILLAIAGIALLRAIRGINRSVRSEAFAMFASGAVLALASYGMFQVWYMAMFGFATVLFAIACRVRTGKCVA